MHCPTVGREIGPRLSPRPTLLHSGRDTKSFSLSVSPSRGVRLPHTIPIWYRRVYPGESPTCVLHEERGMDVEHVRTVCHTAWKVEYHPRNRSNSQMAYCYWWQVNNVHHVEGGTWAADASRTISSQSWELNTRQSVEHTADVFLKPFYWIPRVGWFMCRG